MSEASALAAPSAPRILGLVEEAQRVLSICNACRYCEGYCAVFPALERRLEFSENDVHYLANLCHNCGACLYACQYAPPHEFQLNFPRILAQVRARTYRQYAWPAAFGRAFEGNGVVVSLALAMSLMAFFMFVTAYATPGRLFAAYTDAQGSFYAILPHGVMAGMFGVVGLFVLLAFVMSFIAFWPETGAGVRDFVHPVPMGSAVSDAATLKYLDGGGDGCTYPDARPSFARRTFHHLTFYGFLLCFAATTVATIYHYVFGWKAPYPMVSLPVLLGTLGGAGLLAGPVGLLWLRGRRDPELADTAQDGMDVGFILLLLLTSATGLALLFFRETRAMGVLLAAHLGVVLALFLTLPYGKFMHALYRFAALVRFHIERRRPLPDFAGE